VLKILIFLNALDRFDLVRIELSLIAAGITKIIEYCRGNESQTFGKMDFLFGGQIGEAFIFLEYRI
jgi:hypothetical protein